MENIPLLSDIINKEMKTISLRGKKVKVDVKKEFPLKAIGNRLSWILVVNDVKYQVVTVYSAGFQLGWFEYEGIKFPNQKQLIEGIFRSFN